MFAWGPRDAFIVSTLRPGPTSPGQPRPLPRRIQADGCSCDGMVMFSQGGTGLPLVGTQHTRLVAELAAHVRRSDSFSMIILQGSPGVGKSRIIREVYNSLARSQPEPAYWPILPTIPGDPLALRKCLGPGRQRFVWGADALPSYLWWEFTCRLSDDCEPSDAITEFGPFLGRHTLPLTLAVSRERGVSAEIITTLRSQWRALTEDATNDAAGETLGRMIDWLTPLDPVGIGWMINRLRDVMHWQVNRNSAMRQLADSTLLDGPADMGGDVARSVCGLTDGVLPAVIAVEDLHFAGEDTVSLLTHLRDLDAKVTVLATAWQEAKDHHNYRRLLTQLEGTTSVHRVDEPTKEAVSLLIRYFAPETLSPEADKVAERWPNPFALLTMLTLPRVQKAIERQSGRLVWGPDLTSAPLSLQDLYYARLDQPPNEVKGALSIAAGALPITGETSQAFMPNTVARAACDVRLRQDCLTDVAAIESALQASVEEYSWCISPTPATALFREPMLGLVARRLFDEETPEVDAKELRHRVSQALRAFIDHVRDGGFDLPIDDPQVVLACTWLVTLEGSKRG